MTRPLPLTLLVLAVVAVAVAVAVVTNSGPAAAPSVGTVAITGDALPRAGAETDPALGTVAAELAGEDPDGRPVTVVHNGTPQVVLFLTHWCDVCQAEVPKVQAWIEESGGTPAGVKLRSVITGTDRTRPNYPPSAWLEREGWSVPALLDDEASSAAQAYGLHAYPFWAFLDGDGRVLGRRAGLIEPEELEEIMEALATSA